MRQPTAQTSLFGYGEPRVESDFARARRVPLGAGAWIELTAGKATCGAIAISGEVELMDWKATGVPAGIAGFTALRGFAS